MQLSTLILCQLCILHSRKQPAPLADNFVLLLKGVYGNFDCICMSRGKKANCFKILMRENLMLNYPDYELFHTFKSLQFLFVIPGSSQLSWSSTGITSSYVPNGLLHSSSPNKLSSNALRLHIPCQRSSFGVTQ